jgi:hypothetical protein
MSKHSNSFQVLGKEVVFVGDKAHYVLIIFRIQSILRQVIRPAIRTSPCRTGSTSPSTLPTRRLATPGKLFYDSLSI